MGGNEHQKQGDFTTAQIRELVKLLSNVTVCDPAAGSGAFEVGMLHVLHDVLDNLYHRPNAPKELPEWDDFEQKKSIIAQSLYGVEVKEWAVWINQLRLWLTLFIDMPDAYKESLTPLLPSLNFKVRQGDSLVQRIGNKLFPVQGHAHLSTAIKRKITELRKAKSDFFYNKSGSYNQLLEMENRIFRDIYPRPGALLRDAQLRLRLKLIFLIYSYKIASKLFDPPLCTNIASY
ncbi:MAG: DNA methyltransferase [Candidatus Paceibacterota bacterium]